MIKEHKNLYKDIVFGARVRIFCTTLFTNNNIKVAIQMHSFQFDLLKRTGKDFF